MAKANIPIYRDMVELLKLLMREVKNMPKADNRTLGDNIINRTLNCIYQLQLAYDSLATILLELGKTPNLCSYGFKYGKTVEEIDRRLDFEDKQLTLF